MSGEVFYILVEGSPDSPELEFLQLKINKIFEGHHKISYVPQLFEIGGSSALTNANLAKTFYRLSKAHKQFPVLAIADNDYRVAADKNQQSNNEIMQSQKTKVLYWQRHEWENYLLEETQLIADFVNKFPEDTKKSDGFLKKSKRQVTKHDLDNHLRSYFIESIKEEFFECLKFNLSAKIDSYPHISKPDDFDKKSFEDMNTWFVDIASNRKMTVKSLRPTLYQEIKDEFKWDDLINNSDSFSFDFAKKYFRGKEALDSLVGFIKQNFQCRFDSSEFRIALLKQIDENSPIVSDLTSLLLQELQC